MIWLIGCNGLLGQELSAVLNSFGMEHYASGREVDICKLEALASFANKKNISHIINCAAYSSVDNAEKEIEKAFAVNAHALKNVGAIAKGIAAKVIHISTDYVFDGLSKSPYKEEDRPGPINVYGKSKLKGEHILLKTGAECIIIRTAWLFGRTPKGSPKGQSHNFVLKMLDLLNSQNTVQVVDDEYGCPTWARNLARAILQIIQRGQSYGGDIYHYASCGMASRYDLAEEIKRLGTMYGLINNNCEIKAIKRSAFFSPAQRPAYSVLCKDKIIGHYGLTIPDWKDSLEGFIKDLAKSYKDK